MENTIERKLTREGQSQSTSYRVEVRDTLFAEFNPTILSDGLVGPNWREVQFEKDANPAGIPIETTFGHDRADHNLLHFEGAVALAWTIIGQNRLRLGLECRLIQYKLKTTYSLEREGVVDRSIKHESHIERVPLIAETETGK